MDVKLTLSIDENVIKDAKELAKKDHTSLSKMIENYLFNLTKKESKQPPQDISPLVKSLSGILQLPDDFEFKDERAKYLNEKYK